MRLVCRGRIVASRAVYPLYRIIGTAAAGGIYAAPTSQLILFIIVYGRGRGVPRPYRTVFFYCPVGRGDPTLRGIVWLTQFAHSVVGASIARPRPFAL